MPSQTSTLVDPLNPLTPEFLENPYPTYHKMRDEAPVAWSEKSKYWMCTRYEDIRAMLGDMAYEKQLQRWKQVNPLLKMVPEVSALMKSRAVWMLNMNPPDHTRMRGLVNRAFTPTMVKGMRPHIESIANGLIDGLEGKNEFDFVSEFAFQLPVTVIAEMLGVPKEDREKFKHWSNTLTDTLEPSPNLDHLKKANKANEELYEYLRPLVQDRRREPKNDLISALVAAEEDGKKLTEEELLANCILILVAGHETTVNLIGNSVRMLLQHPDQLALLKSNPELVPGAIGETLRFESPVQTTRRLAGEDMELAGQKIKEGDMMLLFMGAANRDPLQFPDPDKFDITRDTKKHLSYGHGIHHCLGSSLADTEGQVALETLLKRMPDMKVLPQKIEMRNTFALRGVKSLMVSPQ
ncbi:MAG: cytochrome P450 [Candidatus Melainabacteria bacterium]|nr:cytochrome P450 [Candidatus Melainabacteria bacterium]